MIYRGRKNELWQRFAGTKAYLGEGKGEEQADRPRVHAFCLFP
jgi:hypothetical protein